MTSRIPLIVNSATGQIDEIQAGDNLSLPQNDIVDVGNITAIGNVVTGNIKTDHYLYANGVPVTFGGGNSTYGNANVLALMANINGDIIPSANAVYSLGSNTLQWKDLWVSSSTIYINSVPLGVNSSNELLFNYNPVVVAGGPVSNQNIETSAAIVGGNLVVSNTNPAGGVTFADDTLQTTAWTGSVPVANVTGLGNVATIDLNGNASTVLAGDGTWVAQSGGGSNYSNANVAGYLASNTDPTITAIEGNIATLQGNITSLDSEVATLQSNVTTLEGNVVTLTGNVATLESNVSGLESNVATLQSNVSGLESNVTTLQGNVTTIDGEITTIQGNISTLEGNVFAIDANIAVLQGNVANIESNVSTLQGNVTTIEGNIVAIEGNVTTLQGNVANIESNVSTLQGNVTTINGEITTLQGNVGNLESNVSTLQGNVTTIDGEIVTIQGNIGNIEANIATLQGQVYSNANVAAYLPTYTGKLAAANALVGNLSLRGNVIETTDDTMVIDPLADGTNFGNVIILGNLSVTGNTYSTNPVIATTNNLLWQAANNANTAFAASGGGMAVGPVGNAYASFTFNSTSNTWQSSLGIDALGDISTAGNVYAGYLYGDGSNITGLYGNANVADYLANGSDATIVAIQGNVTTLQGNVANIESNVSTLQGNVSAINGNITTLQGNVANIESNVATLQGNVVTLTGNVVTLEGNVSNIEANIATLQGQVYSNANVSGFLPVYGGTLNANVLTSPGGEDILIQPGAAGNTVSYGNISPKFGSTYDLGTPSATWANVFADTVTVGSGLVAAVASPAPVINGFALTGIVGNLALANGNVTANYFHGNGSQLTGITSGQVAGLGNVSAIDLNGNVSTVLAGDGTWVAQTGGGSYGNTEVAAFLPTYNGNLGNVGIANSLGVLMGTPTQGNLVSNALTLTSTTALTDGIAQLNVILGKLVPPAPPAFPAAQTLSISGLATYRMANITQVNNTGNSYTVAAGATVTNVLRSGAYATNTIATAGPGDRGTVTAYRNGAATGNVTLTGSSNGTYGNLIISANQDYHVSNSSITAGFWSVFSAALSGSGSPAGWNDVVIIDSAAGSTNVPSWYYDNSAPGTPTFTGNTFTVGSNTVIYTSTVPHYTSATQFNIGFTAHNVSGNTYPTSNTFVTGTAAGAFQAPVSVAYSQSSLASNIIPSFANAAVSTTALVATGFGSSASGPSVSVNNGYATGTQSFAPGATVLYKTGTTGSLTFLEETSLFVGGTIGAGVVGAVTRIVNPGSGDTPAYTGSEAAFNSQTGPLQTYDAAVVANVLSCNKTNYSTGYLPVGPNLSTQDNTQYFTFKFVAPSTSKFDVYITGTIAGLYVALPGSGIDTSSTLNGWMDASITYAGSGQPGAGTGGNGSNGCALGGVVPIGSAMTAKRTTCTFGTASTASSTGNEVYVRIKLTTGQSVTSLAIYPASN